VFVLLTDPEIEGGIVRRGLRCMSCCDGEDYQSPRKLPTKGRFAMARTEDIPQPTRDAVVNVECPSFDATPFVSGLPLAQTPCGDR